MGAQGGDRKSPGKSKKKKPWATLGREAGLHADGEVELHLARGRAKLEPHCTGGRGWGGLDTEPYQAGPWAEPLKSSGASATRFIGSKGGSGRGPTNPSSYWLPKLLGSETKDWISPFRKR